MDSETDMGAPLMRQFSKQIAGHAVEKGSSKPGMMKHADGSLLKPILAPPRGSRELNFYRKVFDEDDEKKVDDIHSFLKSLLPAFRGVFNNEPNTPGFMKLEDLTDSFNHPCILDIKMGARTYDFEASEQKIQREQQKYKDTKAFGFCIPGMQVYNLKMQKYIYNGKDYGKKLNKETMIDAFRLYLNSDSGMSSNVIRSFLLHLRKVKQWFLMQSEYVFFASSLLLIYDADSLIHCTRDGNSETECLPQQKCSDFHNNCSEPKIGHALFSLGACSVEPDSGDKIEVKTTGSQPCAMTDNSLKSNGCCGSEVCFKNQDLDLSTSNSEMGAKDSSSLMQLTIVRMIDFAHVFQSTERDENYLQGLNTVINLFEGLLKEA